MEVKEASIKGSVLKNKTIRVEPILRQGGWLPQGHDGKFMYTGAKMILAIPYSVQKRGYIDPLTVEERKFFESEEGGLGLSPGDLSVNKKNGNLWETKDFFVKIDKNGLNLDLSDPMDYIRYKILLANYDIIAPSKDTRLKKGTYKFCLVDVDEETETKIKASSNKQNAFLKLGQISESFDRMYTVLIAYRAKYNPKIVERVSKNMSKDTLLSILSDIADTNSEKFLEVVNDENVTVYAEIVEAIFNKIITKSADNTYRLNNEVVGRNMNDLVEHFVNPINQEDYLLLKNKLSLNS